MDLARGEYIQARIDTPEDVDSEYEAFLNLSCSGRGLGITDPRDIIYTHLGMIWLNLKFDWQQNISQVYTTFARNHIKYSRSYEILSQIEDVEMSERREGVPSWVLDWTSMNRRCTNHGETRGETRRERL